MTSRNFGQFLTPPPPIDTLFSIMGLVLLSRNPCPPTTPNWGRDVIYGRLLTVVEFVVGCTPIFTNKCKFSSNKNLFFYFVKKTQSNRRRWWLFAVVWTVTFVIQSINQSMINEYFFFAQRWQKTSPLLASKHLDRKKDIIVILSLLMYVHLWMINRNCRITNIFDRRNRRPSIFLSWEQRTLNISSKSSNNCFLD